MRKLITILGLLSISYASAAFAEITMSQTELRIQTNYNKEYVIEKAYDETVSHLDIRGMDGDDMIVNVFFESAPKYCERVRLGEVTINGKTKLIAKDLERDLSCDYNRGISSQENLDQNH